CCGRLSTWLASSSERKTNSLSRSSMRTISSGCWLRTNYNANNHETALSTHHGPGSGRVRGLQKTAGRDGLLARRKQGTPGAGVGCSHFGVSRRQQGGVDLREIRVLPDNHPGLRLQPVRVGQLCCHAAGQLYGAVPVLRRQFRQDLSLDDPAAVLTL